MQSTPNNSLGVLSDIPPFEHRPLKQRLKILHRLNPTKCFSCFLEISNQNIIYLYPMVARNEFQAGVEQFVKSQILYTDGWLRHLLFRILKNRPLCRKTQLAYFQLY
jgi:hypothetical protein